MSKSRLSLSYAWFVGKRQQIKKKFRRDLVIYVAHRGRVSQRILAEVFGLARSRIGEIVQKHAAIDTDRKKGQHASPLFVMPALHQARAGTRDDGHLRDLVIKIAYRGRVSQRTLAEVFNLAHSRIAAIVAESKLNNVRLRP